ncbi:hypothetical protein BGZ80_003109 [Entomortierella chlamydospora]|uniref:BZIP domain-containing protein n=1 Tax=Entomortierella chlamydospora TaxID=101097 RepID=A0A9P6MNL2_9FUNG|nr:hypothetical protein BGZ80_003109 [Entomortierella chlamydospora]
MTTVGTLSSDIGPGKTNMDLPPAPSNNIPLLITTAADDVKSDTLATSIDGDGPMDYLNARSKLDMEPNPFEQSFLGSATGSGEPTGETSKPVLPPIASISGRLAPNADQFAWNEQSLRMGPLSPSMLEGPQDPIMFDKPVPVSHPVGSFPVTTAPISAVYNSGTTITEGGFPFGMPNAQSVPPSVGPIPTAEPYSQVMYNQQPSVSQMPPQQNAPAPRPQQQQQQQQPPYPHGNGQSQMNERYMSQQGAQHPDNANGYGNLHLLSQATHREMWIKRESMDANSQLIQNQTHQHRQQQGHQNYPPQGGQGMPATPPGMVAAPQLPKNGVEPAFVRSVQRNRMTSEDNSDDSGVSKQSSNSGDKPNKKRSASDDKMDEEEKRKNFLERNRQAALKCRQRKKQWLSNLQAKVEYLTTDNEHLQTQTAALQDEIIHLKALLLAHKDCPVAQANGVYAETIGVPNNHNGNVMPHGRGPMQGQPGQQQQQRNVGGPRGSLPMQMQTGGARVSVTSTVATAGSSNVNGRSMSMSMMQEMAPSATAGQAQASIRY